MNSIVAEKRFISEKLGVPYGSLSQSYLRSETLLGNQSVINFILQSNKKQSQFTPERLLDLNDEFVITHFTLGWRYSDTDPATDIQYMVHTYESPEVSTTDAPLLQSIYNADLSWTIDRTEFVPQFPIRAFRRVPTTQGATLVNAAATAAGVDGFDNGLYGFYPSEPTKIDGRQTIDLAVNMGASVDFSTATGDIVAVFEARGYLIVNSKS